MKKENSVLLTIMGAAACVTAALVMPSVINKTAGRIFKLNINKRRSCKKER